MDHEWKQATRVQTTEVRLLFEEVDDGFPRNNLEILIGIDKVFPVKTIYD